MGAPDHVIAALEATRDDDDFDVWPENWEPLQAFLQVSTQWRVASRGGGMEPVQVYWIGLDYAAVAAFFSGAGISAGPDIWQGLRVIEAAARNRLNGIVETD
ncbi:MAG: DUF1799 domain-containing protein [Sphingomonadales bacterium]|nr:DUF1799 domain-containing protein [Sphingomonadales bacterium]